MAQRILNVRVRPARVAILIDRTAERKDLLLAFEFFSKIWGGRFGQILPVDPKVADPLTEFRLGNSRPDFIYGIGLDDDHWAKATRQACQPRGYGRLRPDFVKEIKQHHFEDYYLVDHALIHRFRTRDQQAGRKQTLRLVTTDELCALSPYCAASFGVHHQNLRKEYFDQDTQFTENTTDGFIELTTEFVKEWQQSWLDVTGHELNPRIVGPGWGWGQLPPTVILVQDHALDLALFWNLRTASETTYPAWIIPIPFQDSTDVKVLVKLKGWLLAFLPYGPRPSYCNVTSQTVGEAACRGFAQLFQATLAGTPIEAVDYEPPSFRLPVVIPYEYETTWAVDIRGQKLTIQPPKPKAFDNLGASRAWFVDLLNDVKSRRAVKDLQLPPSPVVFELLNGPCPPGFEHTAIPRTGDGTDSVNVRCSDNKEIINLYLPTSEEILGEILREHGVEPLPDEKRSSYLPVIKRFGGLHLAAAAFSGQSGMILATLLHDTKTVWEIQGACKLGRGELTGESYIQRIEVMLGRETERMKRVSRQRFFEHARHSAPENLKLRSLLEYWAERKILMRHWRIGPCRRCKQQYFVPQLNIQREVLCTNCGHRISLPATVPVGYTLHRAVKHAIQEGIVPVALTGRFLRNITNHGFFWLPGIKYQVGTKQADIDLLACCDGHLVFCECKRLEQTPPDARVWDEVVTQFLETAEIARRCKGSLAVLSAQVSTFPDTIRNRIKAAVGTSIPFLLLDKLDLEKGYRDKQVGKFTPPVGLHDLLPTRFPERPRPQLDKPRTINMGWGVFTR
jgi:DNA-directed RNA polymerase subunit RPC12/RpoP